MGTGHTVVVKTAQITEDMARMIAQAPADAGIPKGVFNLVTGPIDYTEGTLKVKDGEQMSIGDMAVMDWFVKGVETAA